MWTFIFSILGTAIGFVVIILFPNLIHFDGDMGLGAMFASMIIIGIVMILGMVFGIIKDYRKARSKGKTIFGSLFRGIFGFIIFMLLSVLIFGTMPIFNPVLFAGIMFIDSVILTPYNNYKKAQTTKDMLLASEENKDLTFDQLDNFSGYGLSPAIGVIKIIDEQSVFISGLPTYPSESFTYGSHKLGFMPKLTGNQIDLNFTEKFNKTLIDIGISGAQFIGRLSTGSFLFSTGDHRLFSALPDGTLDTSFRLTEGDPNITRVELSKNGNHIYLLRHYTVSDRPHSNIERINLSGNIDDDFNFRGLTQLEFRIIKIYIFQDGSIMVGASDNVESGIFVINPSGKIIYSQKIDYYLPHATIQSLGEDTVAFIMKENTGGDIDKTNFLFFNSQGLIEFPLVNALKECPYYAVSSLGYDQKGNLIVSGGFRCKGMNKDNKYISLIKITKEGVLDKNFIKKTSDSEPKLFTSYTPPVFDVYDNIYLLTEAGALHRFGNDGIYDAEYSSKINNAIEGRINQVLPLPDGGIVCFGRFKTKKGSITPYLNMIRFLKNGDVDNTFLK
ncbi:CvpA family protein [Candidatus Gracilibacteria bacterium]|nr:CvpA family protein [Candidatus Gracilibacteria bacterium]